MSNKHFPTHWGPPDMHMIDDLWEEIENLKNRIKYLEGKDKKLRRVAAERKRAEDEFEKGWSDGMKDAPCTPTSLDYVRGYEAGREFFKNKGIPNVIWAQSSRNS